MNDNLNAFKGIFFGAVAGSALWAAFLWWLLG